MRKKREAVLLKIDLSVVTRTQGVKKNKKMHSVKMIGQNQVKSRATK